MAIMRPTIFLELKFAFAFLAITLSPSPILSALSCVGKN